MTDKTEEIFKACVKDLAGRCLDDELPKDRQFRNADFLFDEHRVVSELKCLEEDVFRTPKFNQKVKALYDKWIERGLVQPTKYFNLRDIPGECAIEYLNLIKRQIQDSYLKSANDQIKKTKQHLGLDDYQGLLIIANEGNTHLKPSALFNVLHHCFNGGNYSHINQFVLVNVSMMATMPDQDRFLYWFAPQIRGRQPISEKLISALSIKWGEKISEQYGVAIPTHKISAPEYDLVDSIAHITKG